MSEEQGSLFRHWGIAALVLLKYWQDTQWDGWLIDADKEGSEWRFLCVFLRIVVLSPLVVV